MSDITDPERCKRCRKPAAVAWWSCCAMKGRGAFLCAECDLLLNDLFLRFLRVRNRSAALTKYEEGMSRRVLTKGEASFLEVFGVPQYATKPQTPPT